MNFLEKLDKLMEQKDLNKHSLSEYCGIPYTTIDGWYKKGYDNIRITTLKKLSDFFGTSLDFWAFDENERDTLSIKKQEFIASISKLDDDQLELLYDIVDSLRPFKAGFKPAFLLSKCWYLA